jgi:hypothetical protein
MVVKNWVSGKDTVLRLPSIWKTFMILETTDNLEGKRWESWTKAPYMLLQEISQSKILKSLKPFKEIFLNNPLDLYSILGFPDFDLPLNDDNFEEIQEKLKRKFVFHLKIENINVSKAIFHKVFVGENDYPILDIVVPSRKPFSEGGDIKYMILVTNVKLSTKKTVICDTCDNSFTRNSDLIRHEKSKEACSTEIIVSPKQKMYGLADKTEEELLEAGLIGLEHVGFRQKSYLTWDCETLESPNDDDSREQAILSLASISIISSLDEKPTCFIRSGDGQDDVLNLVRAFIDFIEQKCLEFNEATPKKFQESLKFIKDEEQKMYAARKEARENGIKMPPLKLYPAAWKRFLKNNCTLKCYSYNGGKFDMKVISEQFFVLKTNDGVQIDVLKIGAKYFNYSYKFLDSTISFNDVMNYTSPGSMANFLKMCGITEKKSCFPYQKYNSIQELKDAKEFPEFEDFYSDLIQASSCTREEYETAKNEYSRRLILDENDPDKMRNMADFLAYYNNLDVGPLSQAIKVSA